MQKTSMSVISSSDDMVASPPVSKIPDGGFQAWLVVFGGFLNYITTFGLLNSWGLFQTYYEDDHLDGTSHSTISWIGSVQLFILFLGGLFVGPAFDKYGAVALTAPGFIIYSLSFMLTSLATEYYQILLAQGFLYGIANAMIFYPSMLAIPHWFDSRRGLALGIVVSGSSIGGVIWPIAIQRMLLTLGFPWTLRTIGFITLVLQGVAVFLITVRRDPSQQAKGFDMNVMKKELLDPRFLILTAAFLFIYLGMFIPFYYIPTYGISHGMDETLANELLSILNGGSFFGRIISGLAADKLGRFNITSICAIITGVILLSLLAMTVTPTIIAFSVLLGFFSGGLISLQSACVAQITPNINLIGVKIGMMMAVCSITVLVGGPIGGTLLEYNEGSFHGLIIFSAVTLLFGAALLLLSRVLAERDWKKAF